MGDGMLLVPTIAVFVALALCVLLIGFVRRVMDERKMAKSHFAKVGVGGKKIRPHGKTCGKYFSPTNQFLSR
jgi:hypothetical protein